MHRPPTIIIIPHWLIINKCICVLSLGTDDECDILLLGDKMARQARSKQQSSLFSIKQKTSQKLFRDRHDRQEFVSILKNAKAVYGLDIYAYCLLDDDEFWIILNAKHRSIASIMQSITIQYALYRKDVEKLFSNRYHSKPLFTVADLEAEITELKSDPRYTSCSYCFYSTVKNTPLPFISLTNEPVNIAPIHLTKLSDDSFLNIVAEKVTKEIMGDVSLRNALIQDIYASYNVTQKQLADYFDLSCSAISKIIRQGA